MARSSSIAGPKPETLLLLALHMLVAGVSDEMNSRMVCENIPVRTRLGKSVNVATYRIAFFQVGFMGPRAQPDLAQSASGLNDRLGKIRINAVIGPA